jgi:hypothetical protein
VDLSGVAKELRAKGESVFAEEAGDKARVWWDQSGNSAFAKMKSAWFEASKKRATEEGGGGGGGGAPGEPAAKRLPLTPAVVQAVDPGGGAQDGGAVSHL